MFVHLVMNQDESDSFNSTRVSPQTQYQNNDTGLTEAFYLLIPSLVIKKELKDYEWLWVKRSPEFSSLYAPFVYTVFLSSCAMPWNVQSLILINPLVGSLFFIHRRNLSPGYISNWSKKFIAGSGIPLLSSILEGGINNKESACLALKQCQFSLRINCHSSPGCLLIHLSSQSKDCSKLLEPLPMRHWEKISFRCYTSIGT